MMEKMSSNEELVEMLRREYLRKLTRYRITDEFFRKKYGMTYEVFEKENVVAKRDFSWEVESDSQEWEIAIDGIKTCLRKLGEVEIVKGEGHISIQLMSLSRIFSQIREVDIKEFIVKALKLLDEREIL